MNCYKGMGVEDCSLIGQKHTMNAHVNIQEVSDALTNIIRPECPHHDLQEDIDEAFTTCFSMLHPDGYQTDEESRQSIDYTHLNEMLLRFYRTSSAAVQENEKLRNAIVHYRYKLTRPAPANNPPLPRYEERDAAESNSGVNPVDSVGSA